MTWEQFNDLNFDDMNDSMKEQYLVYGTFYGYGLGLTQTETMNKLRDLGMKFANERYGNIWNSIDDEQRAIKYFNQLNEDIVPDSSILPYRSYIGKGYLYVAEYNEYDEDGKFIRTITGGVYSEENLTRKEATEKLIKELQDKYGMGNPTDYGFKIVGALRGDI